MNDINNLLPRIYLVRHGETEWTVSRRHTGTTDIDLTAKGVADAQELRLRLEHIKFSKVLTSPLLRAHRTAELAGYANSLEIEPALHEWHYGDYEGITSHDIQKENPGWNVFRDGCPKGESVEEVGKRADQIIYKLKAETGNIAIFSHAHFLRALAARWILETVSHGQRLLLGTSSISILGFEHASHLEPVIEMWNETPASTR